MNRVAPAGAAEPGSTARDKNAGKPVSPSIRLQKGRCWGAWGPACLLRPPVPASLG